MKYSRLQNIYQQLMNNCHNLIVVRILKFLPNNFRRNLFILACLIFVTSIMEMVCVTTLALLGSSLTDPDTFLKSNKIALLIDFTGLPSSLSGREFIVYLCLVVTGAVLIKNVMTGWTCYHNALISARIDAFYGDALLSSFVRKEYEWHLQKNSADLVTLLDWCRLTGQVIIFNAINVANDLIMILALVATLFVAAPLVSAGVFVTVGAVAGLMYLAFRPYLDRVSQVYSKLQMKINRHVTKCLHGIKEIKIFDQERMLLDRYRVDVDEYSNLEALVRLLLRAPAWIMEGAGFLMLSLIIVIMVGVYKISTAQISSTVALLAVSAWRILPAANRVISNIATIRTNRTKAEAVLSHLDRPQPESGGQPISPDQVALKLTFDHTLKLEKVVFQFQEAEAPVLRGISFNLLKGQSLGVIGRSGSGKSTLADVLVGLLPPREGRILLDQRELLPQDRSQWRAKVGYVGQAPYICDGTLAANIAFGLEDSEIDLAKVQTCCTLAAIDDFLPQLSQGLLTSIGERGVRLSGGQRQRVAIARALYRDPDILILDEATSALDPGNEEAIQRTIINLYGRLTMIIIAHRLSTVTFCDQLLWLDDGSVREIGPARVVIENYRHEMKKFASEILGANHPDHYERDIPVPDRPPNAPDVSRL